MFEKFNPKFSVVKIIGNSAGYTITVDGVVNTNKLREVPVEYINDIPHVEVEFLGETKKHNLFTLVACHFKWLNDYPTEILKQVEGFCLDPDDVDNLTYASNVGYRFKQLPLEHLEHKGYYYIQGYPQLFINKQSVMVNNDGSIKRLHKTKPGAKNSKGGYYTGSLYLEGGIALRVSRHRAMLLAFEPIPNDIEQLVANHIDGVPGNDDIDNLEWVTRSGNIVHAYNNNLRNDNKPIVIRNIRTNEVSEFISANEAARGIGVSPTGMNLLLNKRKFGSINSKGYQAKFQDDDRDWVEIQNVEEEIQKAVQRLGVKARNCETLEEHIFASISEANRFCGVNSISFRFKNQDYTPMRGWQFIPEDMDEFPPFSDEEYQKSIQGIKAGVNARNIVTKETIYFSSIAKATNSGLGSKYLAHRLRAKQQPLYKTGWQFKLESEPDWIEIDNVEDTLYSLESTVMGYNVETKQIYVAESANQMAAMLNLDSKSIRVAALTRGKKIYKGFRFRLGVSDLPWD